VPINDPSVPPLSLPDDPPNPLKTKMGPLGQVSLAVAPAAKKKAKALPKQPDAAGLTIPGGLGNAAAQPPNTSTAAALKVNDSANAAPPAKKKKPKKDQGMIPPPPPASLPSQPSLMVS
jgi:hypothetical protein